ncbi:MAG: DUF3375 domain-containing protein [Actinomycetota bacterium]|nr:DUF3375 domain-containing protein [Actinomycetota bacterium]
MSDIAGELARVCEAFEKPTLRLLDRKWAPLVLAVFKSSFSRDQRSVAAERLHAQVDTYLGELRSVGEQVPNLQGRALCLRWMNDQWLFRTTGESGQEEYSLTSHALEALDLVQALSRERALISESRINTILDAVRRWATEANPDRQARIERLEVQIRQLTSERDRLAAGGDVAAATEDRMLDGYANLVDLIGQLPSDFKRVEESVLGMHRQIISDFRSEERPIGQVLDDYLAKTDELTKLTAEGRAFEGAFALLRDEALILDLKSDLQAILEHPFALALSAGEQRDFRGTVTIIRRGIDDVLAQRSRLTTTLRDHIVNHDVVRDRELDATLRQINQQLAIWMETAGPRAAVPVVTIPPPIDVEHLRERFWDPANEVPPPPLEDVSDAAPDPPNLDDIRSQGGPSLFRLRRGLLAALDAGDSETVGEMFNALPVDLRRPVEILGLLHLLASGNSGYAPSTGDQALEGALDTRLGQVIPASAAAEVFDAIRPDGTRRQFLVPRLEISLADARNSAHPDEGTPA